MFQDVYRWAGDIRNCNIAKQDLFCLTEHIELFGNDVFNKLKKEKYFIGYDKETTLDKLVELFADIKLYILFVKVIKNICRITYQNKWYIFRSY